MILTDQILELVAGIPIPQFFITVEFSSLSDTIPTGIEKFLQEKHQMILKGATGRKFVFKESGWRMIFTFFPTDKVVEERYALKNKCLNYSK